MHSGEFAPRAQLHRPRIMVELSAHELSMLTRRRVAGSRQVSATRQTLTLARPLDRLTAERLEQVGVVPEARLRHDVTADNGQHHQHVPADAETLAWNRAREAEWHAAPAALEAALRELAPAVFNDSPPPLTIGISDTLIELLAGEFDAAVIGRFLADWTRRPAYLEAVARGDLRRDLDGHPTDAPADSARAFAAALLCRRGVTP